MKYSGLLAHRGPLPLAANRLHTFHLFGFQSILRTCSTPRISKKICAANTSGQGISGNGDPNGFRSSNPFQAGSTRLGQIIGARTRELIVKFNSVRKNFPLKIFLLLLGFYTANALATILGQTGDWDVLVAAILVAVIEGIGFLMYRMPQFLEKFQFIVDLLNYWKAGLSFGLFVDAFKLGS